MKLAHLQPCASPAVYIGDYPRTVQKIVFGVHADGFAFIADVAVFCIYDDLNTAITTIFAAVC